LTDRNKSIATRWKKTAECQRRFGYRKMIMRRFILPDGREIDYDLLELGEIVCILALTASENVVIAKQFRPGPEQVLLDLPGGMCEAGECPSAAAAREMVEETGYTTDQLIYLCSTQISAYSVGIRHHFVATNCRLTQAQCLDENEFIEAIEIPLGPFIDCLRRGLIVDVATAYLGLDHLGLI
jgi:ADP-ribose pyrophosphatase